MLSAFGAFLIHDAQHIQKVCAQILSFISPIRLIKVDTSVCITRAPVESFAAFPLVTAQLDFEGFPLGASTWYWVLF